MSGNAVGSVGSDEGGDAGREGGSLSVNLCEDEDGEQAEGDVTEQTVGGAGCRPTVCRRPVAADLASV